jgi:16S rRNA processing protein RimM
MPSNPPPFLLLGQVLRPHGVRGELRVEVLTAYPERIGPDMTVYLGSNPDKPATATAYQVVQARTHQQYLILQLEGITDRNAADRLRECYVMVPLDEAVPLDEDEFYLYQAIGLAVYADTGEDLGRVVDIIETGANDVYVVQGPRGEILLPSIADCILDVDVEAGKMTVHLLDGLLGD